MHKDTAAMLALLAALSGGYAAPALAAQEQERVYERAFFAPLAPQTALEMIERLPGFTLQEADEDRGLGQGGTNVLINGRPITGKGEAATNQIAQIAAGNVVEIEILDGASLDIPGFSGLVANIITERAAWSGSVSWEPEFRQGSEPALGIGTLALSGSLGDVDLAFALDGVSVRRTFVGPESVADINGLVFEERDESLAIIGDQPEVSGSLAWERGNGHFFNAKASLSRLDLNREQISRSRALTARGFSGLNIGRFAQIETTANLDADYTLPAFGGELTLIAAASATQNEAATRVSVDDVFANALSRQGFEEDSTAFEGIVRFEQSWGSAGRSWQLAGEAVINELDLETSLLAFDPASPDIILSSAVSQTLIEEERAELTLSHSRALTERSDLQISLGAETSTISQGSVERSFVRPKGFAAYTLRPTGNWTLTGRVAREVGQIRFRDFAASVSLFEQVSTQNNPELVPEQSWVLTARAERRFADGHIASLEIEHEEIEDLVDQIPLGASGNAIGNIEAASRSQLAGSLTLLGAPFGLDGAQLELSGTWRTSSLIDPIEGFEREIGGLQIRDLRADLRHDLPGTNWAYGFSVQDRALAPTYQSTLVQYRNVPPGGLTPGINSVFVEHGDVMGLRVRVEVSEFINQTSDFSRTIYAGRRDSSTIDRTETRARSLNGPHFGLRIGRSF